MQKSYIEISHPELKPSFFWWSRNFCTVIYFLRELTGLGIVAAMIFFVLDFAGLLSFPLSDGIYRAILRVGFFSSIFHSITWLWIIPKVTPLDLSKRMEFVCFFFLLVALCVVSYFLYFGIYVASIF